MRGGAAAASFLRREEPAPHPETGNRNSGSIVQAVELIEKKESKETRRGNVEEASPPKGTAKPNKQGQVPFVQIPMRRNVDNREAPRQKRRVTIEESQDGDEPALVPRDTSDPLPVVDRREPAFSKKAPIEDPETMESVGRELLDLEFPISLRALTSISPEAREYLRKLLTRRRVPRDDRDLTLREKRLLTYLESLHPTESERYQNMLEMLAEDDPVCEQNVLMRNPVFGPELPEASCFYAEGQEGIPDGALVVSDPVEIYFNALDEEETPRPVVVARESYPLTCIYPEINGVGIEESLLDGGSQICSIGEESAKRLNLSWDPRVRIFLQSANTSTERTLGLARNVPFNISGIVAYLQLHVVPRTAYKCLLGRPFDVLMGTTIHNKRSGEQLITVEDPNSGRALTVPTFARGRAPASIKQKLEAERWEYLFRDLRN
jgi:hypothetical protein